MFISRTGNVHRDLPIQNNPMEIMYFNSLFTFQFLISDRKKDSRGPTPTMDNGKYKESNIPVMGVTVYSTAHGESSDTKTVTSRPRCKDYDGNTGFSISLWWMIIALHVFKDKSLGRNH